MRDMVTATMKSGIGQFFMMLLSMGSMKILALIAGPAGVGLFSLLRNAQQSLTAIAALGGGGNAIVQGVASWPLSERGRYISTAFWVFLGVTLLVGLCLLLLPAQLFRLILEEKYANILPWMVVPVAASAAMVFFRSILNANLEIGAVAWVNVMVALGALLCVAPASIAFNAGHPVSLVFVLCGSFCLGAVAAIYLVNSRCHSQPLSAIVNCPPSRRAAVHLLRIAFPTMIASFVGMGSVLLVRTIIVKWHGISAAGWFDVSWGIGSVYLTLFLTSLQTYLLPAVSSSAKGVDLETQVKSALRFSMMAVVPVITALVVLKPMVVQVLYSRDFLPALEIMRWTLLGDLVRAFGSILATVLVARADMSAFLLRELVWSFIFASIAYVLLPLGIWGAGVAYLVAYVVYLSMHLWRIWRDHAVNIDLRALIEWAGGIAIVLAASLLTWTDTAVAWPKLALIGFGFAYSWIVMTKNEQQFLSLTLARVMKRITRLV